MSRDSHTKRADIQCPEEPNYEQQKQTGIPLTRKLCYGIGGMPYQMTSCAKGFFMQIFLLDVVQMTPLHVSVILFLGRAWDAITDPLVGYMVSRSGHTPIGKLIPWIVYSMPLGVVSYIMQWYIPQDNMSPVFKFCWYFGWCCLFDAFISCYHVPYTSLNMFLGGDRNDRDSATCYRMGMEMFAILAGATIQGQMVGVYHTKKVQACSDLNESIALIGNYSSVLYYNSTAYFADTLQNMAQTQFAQSTSSAPAITEGTLQPGSSLYPNLEELGNYMGLSLTSDEVQKNLALIPAADNQVAVGSGLAGMVRPVTGADVGIRRAEIRPGLREVILCKDQDGKVGLRLREIDNGVFIQLVQANSPASLAGLRFGDQVLQINGQNCAGWSTDKAHKALKAAAEQRIELVVRDRPFQRTITMHKDSSGHVGFIFKSGRITSLVKDGSAARNGLLTDHYICEINGQNVIGLKDPQIKDILTTSPNTMTITIMPKIIYEHMIKRMSGGLLRSAMDHSVPEV
ncbi:Syntenin-1 [Bagarius yarrelli]|uniref:Syntenin-1 n=1 Tax=Bagarius yarrelli TaxID=175774 RepID=A0A556U2J6_BAGYA|nr:Syntenin-1 [Bagarius yarrelli]